MKGLLLKDFYNLSRMGKKYLLICAVMCIWAFTMKNPGFISMYITICSSMMVLSSFSYDEYSKFEKYALTMPIEKKTLVQEKYALMLIAVVGGTLAGIPLSGLLNLIVKEDFMELIAVAIVLGSVFLITYSVIFPTIFKEGVEKARMQMVGVYMVIFIAIFLFAKSLGQTEGFSSFHFLNWMVPAGAMLVAAIVFVLSYVKSLKVIEKKEW